MTATAVMPVTPAVPTDPTPVELAVIDGIVGGYDPETFLWIVFRRPDGGARIWYAWTAGGEPLGDQVDREALAAGYDCADWLHIGRRHVTQQSRGRVTIDAYPLRLVQGDVRCGLRAPEVERDKVRLMLGAAATGNFDGFAPPVSNLVRWMGVGPALVRKTR